MTPINFHKKEKPLTSLVSMGGGAAGMAHAGLAEKVYVDEVFSNWAYRGDNSGSQLEANGIDLAGEGGLVWIKDRDAANNHVLFDTKRLPTQMLRLGGTTAGNEDVGAGFWGAASNGFTHGNWDGIGQVKDYASWTFRNQDGFFKVIKWTGNGVSGRQIAHGLGSTPGFVMTKALDNSDGWRTLHSWDFSKILYISNDSAGNGSSSQAFSGSVCDATYLTVTSDGSINANGQEYIAYVFAGGPSSAATARSVDFDGSGDYLTTNQSSDYAMGTGDFTVEGWFKINSGSNFGIFMNNTAGLGGSYGLSLHYYSSYGLAFYASGSKIDSNIQPTSGQWFHAALVRNSGTTSLYYNGILTKSASDSTNYTGEKFVIAGYESTSYLMNGSVSNFRVVKGTALYTSSFKPTYKPLTNITNTKLLCCNNSSVTGTTTGTVTSSGDPTASTDSPFLDPDGYKFGDDGEQNLIKCGSYTGNTTTAPEINCGWEPSFIMIKCTSQGTTNWSMYDCIRGIVTGGNEHYLYPNLASVEYSADRLELTPTGFKVVTGGGVLTNVNGGNYIYIAIRRPDPLVGKPPSAGTDVFAMDTGNSSSTIPNYDSTFPVDWALMRQYASSDSWHSVARLTGTEYMFADTTAAGTPYSSFTMDSNLGWSKGGGSSSYQSWMWKRGAGFDVVTYGGNGVTGRRMPHSLGVAPEMMWVKRRNATEHWYVYHKGVNGGTNPADYMLYLDTDNVKMSHNPAWDSTVPTSTDFTLGADTAVNSGGTTQYVAMLFATVPGISKCGYYTGNGSSRTISDVGFLPRFIIFKRTDVTNNWIVLDTTRGWSSGNDAYMRLNTNNAQISAMNFGEPTSTGFTLPDGNPMYNENNGNYIYYAHA